MKLKQIGVVLIFHPNIKRNVPLSQIKHFYTVKINLSTLLVLEISFVIESSEVVPKLTRTLTESDS